MSLTETVDDLTHEIWMEKQTKDFQESKCALVHSLGEAGFVLHVHGDTLLVYIARLII